MTIGAPTRIMTFLRCNLAGLIVGLMVIALPVTFQSPQPANAASIGTGFCASTVDDTSGVIVTVASNGDCIVSFATAWTTGGNEQVITRNWTVPALVRSVDVLVVAGGGGGGSSNSQKTGGAGGGGGVVVATSFVVTPGAIIGTGTGVGGIGQNCANGNRGGNSYFGSLTAIGGGWGSGCSATEGKGGSGGGGHHRVGAATIQTTAPGTSSNGVNITAYGNVGGNASADAANGGGGGGGGATQVGGNATGSGGDGTGGNGGEGIANSFRTGSPIIYGSGGGGGGNAFGGSGGTNAGNGCGTDTSGVGGIHGVNETGGGGGGGMKCQTSAGRGGSGIVVIRYGLPALAQPSNVVAVATPSQAKSIDVSWDAVSDAQSYIVRIRGNDCSTISGSKSGIVTTSATVTRFDMSSSVMGDNTTYKVTVAAVGDGVNYATSNDAQCVSVTTNAAVAIPTITTQPISLNRTVGQRASLSVVATSSDGGVLSYKWFKDNVEIANATANTYVIDSVASVDAGSYTVEVFNTLSEVSISSTSTAATLTIANALSISTPSVGLSGTANSSYSVTVAGAGGRNVLVYSLTGSLTTGLSLDSSTGIISGTPTAVGTSTVSVTVTDANNATASTSDFTIAIGRASSSISIDLAVASPTYGTVDRITATTSRAGTVDFMIDGISISGCGAVAAASTTAECDWVPTAIGLTSLSATFTPSSAVYATSTATSTPDVQLRPITVTPTAGQSKAYGADDGALRYSITSGSLYGNDELTGSLSRANGESVTTYAITGGSLGNANYAITFIPATFRISKASQTNITLSSTSGTYGTDLTLRTSGGSGSGEVSYAVTTTGTANCSITDGNTLSATSPGTCTVTATKDASSFYLVETSSATTVTFAKKTQTSLAVSTTSGDLVTGIIVATTGGSGTGAMTSTVTAGTANCTITSGVVTAKSTGTCSLTVTKAADTTYLVETVMATLTFTAAPVVTTPVSPASTVAQGQTDVAAVTTTTLAPVVAQNPTVTTTTTVPAAVNSRNRTAVTTSTTTTTSTVTPKLRPVAPSLVNTPSAIGAATIGGKTATAKTTRVNNQLVFTAGGFTVTLAGVRPDGSIIPLTTEGLLEVRRGDTFRLDAQGFAPGSEVNIWMFSKPLLLSNIEVGANGLVRSTLKVPKSVSDGLHHLVMVGVDKANAEAKFEVGMNVGVPPKQWWYSRVLIAIPITLAVFIGFWLPTTARRRKRRATI